MLLGSGSVLQAQESLRLLRRGQLRRCVPRPGSCCSWLALPKPQADSVGEGVQRDGKNCECGETEFFVTAITDSPPCVVVGSRIAGIV